MLRKILFKNELINNITICYMHDLQNNSGETPGDDLPGVITSVNAIEAMTTASLPSGDV